MFGEEGEGIGGGRWDDMGQWDGEYTCGQAPRRAGSPKWQRGRAKRLADSSGLAVAATRGLCLAEPPE